MLEKMLEVGSAFDWITPLAALVGDVVNGPSHTFLIPYDSSPLSGREIEVLLKRRGVRSWGVMIVSGTLMVTVRLNQARWAQHLLEQAGVPLDNPLPSHVRGRRPRASRSRHRRTQGSTRAVRKSEMGTLLDSIDEVLSTRLD